MFGQKKNLAGISCRKNVTECTLLQSSWTTDCKRANRSPLPHLRGLSSEPDTVAIFIDLSCYLIQLGNPSCPRSDPTLLPFQFQCLCPTLATSSADFLFSSEAGTTPFPFSSFLPSPPFPQFDTAVCSGDPSEDRTGITWFNTSISSAPSQIQNNPWPFPSRPIPTLTIMSSLCSLSLPRSSKPSRSIWFRSFRVV